MNLSRATVALYMALVFVSGSILGVFGDRYYNSVKAVAAKGKAKGKDRRMSPDEYRRTYIEFMERRLSLSADQVAKLGQFMDDTQRSMEEVMRRTVPEQQSLRQQQTDKIRSMLNEDQKIEYEKMLKEREERNKNKRAKERPGR